MMRQFFSHMMFVAMCLASLTFSAQAETVFQFPDDPEEADFIANEVLMTFYHELGHGLIDQLQLPVLGKEEDAADMLSVILMNDTWDEESASAILTSDATSYALMAAEEGDASADTFADVHSLSIQRYYTVVCLFYGANPDQRGQLAKDLGLPEDRMDSCPGDYEQASSAWAQVLDGTDPGPDSKGLEMAAGLDGVPLADLLAGELDGINQRFGLPEAITVTVADCGEANAYYSPSDRTITLCNEYAQDLQRLWEKE